MFEQWIPLQRYKLLRPSEDAVAPDMPPSVRFSEWFTLRRVRTALLIGTLLLAIISVSHFAHPTPGPLPPQDAGDHFPATGDGGVRWSDFAYVQYVTNGNYLCNSLMILEALHRSATKADRIMMYPEEWKVPEGSVEGASTEGKLLVQARDLYGAKLVPIQVQSFAKGDATWKDSYTKLLAFNQTQYKRVLSLDSDATVRKVSSCQIFHRVRLR